MNIKLALDAHQKMFTDLHSLLPLLEQSAQLIVGALKNGGTLFICGNGGSAADAQHIAAEFTGRYKKERRSLPAIALTTDTSAITAIGNDYNYDRVFSRQLEGLGRKDDILLAISTSGNSPNVLETIRIARDRGMEVIGLTGRDGGIMSRLCDVCMIAPSNETARIQEAHIFCYHVLCEIVDESF